MSDPSVDIVIPTFNRGVALAETVSRILKSDLEGLGRLEVIVVDDGSERPAADVLVGIGCPSKVTLRQIRQANSGPARARNAGYRAGSGEIVLFMDDDILPGPDLLRRHVLAHQQRPGSVIYGVCDWLPPSRPGTLFRLIRRLGGERMGDPAVEYALVPIVASGQISVERQSFPDSDAVYRDDLVTPAAEEYELSLRLRRRGIPILLAHQIVAQHDAPVALLNVCRQQYKHGMGCGEAARRCPETLELEELARIIRASRGQGPSGSRASALRSKLRQLATSPQARAILVRLAGLAQTAAPRADVFGPLYRLAIAVHFVAGVRDGLERFAPAPEPPSAPSVLP